MIITELNKNKLKGRIVEIYGSQAKFSDEIRVSEQTITAKLNGRSEFSRHDMALWSQALKIPAEDIPEYFFA